MIKNFKEHNKWQDKLFVALTMEEWLNIDKKYLTKLQEKVNESLSLVREISKQEYKDFDSSHIRLNITDKDELSIKSICDDIFDNIGWASNNSTEDEYVLIMDFDIDGDIVEILLIFRKYDDNWWTIHLDNQESGFESRWFVCDDIIGLKELKNINFLL